MNALVAAACVAYMSDGRYILDPDTKETQVYWIVQVRCVRRCIYFEHERRTDKSACFSTVELIINMSKHLSKSKSKSSL